MQFGDDVLQTGPFAGGAACLVKIVLSRRPNHIVEPHHVGNADARTCQSYVQELVFLVEPHPAKPLGVGGWRRAEEVDQESNSGLAALGLMDGAKGPEGIGRVAYEYLVLHMEPAVFCMRIVACFDELCDEHLKA